MRGVVRPVAWALVFAALAVAAIAWFTPKSDLDADDAESTAVGAFAEVGVEADVVEPVVRAEHSPADGDPVEVWVVPLEVGEDEIETRVLVEAAQLVYVDDRIGADGQERLLTDDEFLTIADYRDNSKRNDWVRRNAMASVAGVLIAGVSFVVAKRSDRLWEAP